MGSQTGKPITKTQARRIAEQVFDEKLAELDRRDTIAALKRGLADMKAGRYRPAGDAIDKIRKEYGLPRA